MTALANVLKLSTQLGASQKGEEPYIGPRSFRRTAEDTIRFFGRDEETDEIVSLISAHKLVLVYAQSGAGKTSIFNAQVIPTLESHGFEVLPVARVQVTDPSSTFAINSNNTNNNINSNNNNNSSLLQIENVYIFNAIQSLNPNIDNPKLLANKSLSEFLTDYFPNQIDDNGEVVPQVLIFDQLEELFNFSAKKWKQQQEAFFKQISQALNNNSSLRIALIIREDHLAELDPFQSLLPEKLRPRFRLERLREEAAILAVKGPLEKTTEILHDRNKSQIEDEIRKLVKNLMKIQIEEPAGYGSYQIEGEFVEPIYLQIVCQKWWREQLSSSSSLSHNVTASQDTLRSFGDVDKALEEYYENAIRDAVQHTNITEKEIREWCGNQLITSSETRSIVHQSGNYTAGMPNNVVDILDKKYYLIRPESRSGGVWYELTHDRLIKPITNSNMRWKEKERKRKAKRNRLVIIPSVVATVVAVTIIMIVLFGPHGLPTHPPIVLPMQFVVETGMDPIAIGVDANNNTVYVVNRLSNTVSVIEGKTKMPDIVVGGSPTGVAVNQNTRLAYVANRDSNTVSVIDGKTKTVVGDIQVDDSPHDVAVNPNTNMVYVANSGSNTTSVIDGKTNNVVKNVTVGVFPIG
ncbi:MAG: hypothetical protein WA667_03175, partial [Candidatus Nitrosopolaris sp.]